MLFQSTDLIPIFSDAWARIAQQEIQAMGFKSTSFPSLGSVFV